MVAYKRAYTIPNIGNLVQGEHLKTSAILRRCFQEKTCTISETGQYRPKDTIDE